MAKLSAHGHELARIERALPDSEYFTDQKDTRVLMSDGWILKKWSYRFKPGNITYKDKEPLKDSGWKLAGKLPSMDKSLPSDNPLKLQWTPIFWLKTRLETARPDGTVFTLIHAHGIPEYNPQPSLPI